VKGTRNRKNFMILTFLIGLSIFLYPALSDYIARRNVVQGANTYKRQITDLSDEKIEKMWQEARAYNDSLTGNPVPDPFIPGSGRVLPENYLRVLNMGDGIMGYINIPKIKVYLPILHGASEEALIKGAGHIEQTTLPIGGEGNLAVITAHTGLASAEMFNRLIELETGDIFMIHVLDEILTYEVDDIRVILPEEIESLFPVDGEDYVTLVTCTPYGVNSHRLLVRGSRIPNTEQMMRTVEKAPFPYELLVIIGVALFIVTSVLIWDFRKEQNQRGKNKA
jgi:LPXTG-site transpeptidase (sortase) family protein